MKKSGTGWQVKSLGEVANVKSGFAFKSDDYLNEGVRLVRIGNLTGSELEFNSNTVYVDKINLKQYRDFALKANDVLIAMSGATTGKLAFVKEEDLPCLLNQRVGLISIPNDSQLNSQYLFYYLAKGDLRKDVLKMAGGSAQPNISPTQIMSFKIPLPPLPIQKQIAGILEKADQAKQKRKEANKLTEQFLQSAFIEMFGDPVKNPIGLSFDLLGNHIEVVTKGETPLWKGESYKKEGILFLRSENILNGKIDISKTTFISEELHERMKRSQVRRNDVLLNIVGASIGRSAIYCLDIKANLNQAIAIIRPLRSLLPSYLCYYLNSDFARNIYRDLQAGVARDNLSLTQIKNFSLPIPPISLQQQFAELVQKTEALKEKQKASEKELENLFNSLMQKAFKGELT